MKRSRSGHFGFCGSCRITSKNSVTRISTAESDPPGCPDLACVIISTISRRICLAIACSSATLLVLFITYFQCSNARRRYVEPACQFGREVGSRGKQDAVHANRLGALNVRWPVVQKEGILGRDAQTAQAMLIDLGRWFRNTQLAGKRPLIEFRQPFGGEQCIAHGE